MRGVWIDHAGAPACGTRLRGLDGEVVHDLLDAFNLRRYLPGMDFLVLSHHNTIQLHCAIEGTDIHIGVFVNRRIIQRALHFGTDRSVIDVCSRAPVTLTAGQSGRSNGGSQSQGKS